MMQDEIDRQLRVLLPMTALWLGGSDRSNEGEWRWVEGPEGFRKMGVLGGGSFGKEMEPTLLQILAELTGYSRSTGLRKIGMIPMVSTTLEIMKTCSANPFQPDGEWNDGQPNKECTNRIFLEKVTPLI